MDIPSFLRMYPPFDELEDERLAEVVRHTHIEFFPVGAVIQHQAFDWLDAPIERVGSKFTPIPFAPVMENFVVPHATDVLEAIRRTVQRNG